MCVFIYIHSYNIHINVFLLRNSDNLLEIYCQDKFQKLNLLNNWIFFANIFLEENT